MSASRHGEIYRKYAFRIEKLDEEEKLSAKNKDADLNKRRRAGVARMSLQASKKRTIRDQTIQFFFEYNTVEGVLLVCSVLICLLGVMLDSDYVADGRHVYTRDCITYITMSIIFFSIIYFSAVLWQEIVTAIFPSLSFSCLGLCADGKHRGDKDKDDDENLDDGIEMADGNANFAVQAVEKKSDAASLYTVEEQIKMKELIGRLQDENRGLKKDAVAAQKAVPIKAAIKKFKKGLKATETFTVDTVTPAKDDSLEFYNPMAGKRGKK
jgi:hypothetical protein